MSEVNIELCPETGICSILSGNTKADLMPDEVAQLKSAAGDIEKIKAIISEADSSFADSLDEDALRKIGAI
ncbi:MAG: hypothetical protein ACYTFY_12350 [Planctomycetota bacterium]|jgi:hypothetical protein